MLFLHPPSFIDVRSQFIGAQLSHNGPRYRLWMVQNSHSVSFSIHFYLIIVPFVVHFETGVFFFYCVDCIQHVFIV